MKIVGYGVLVSSVAALTYFIGSLLWFAFVGRRQEERKSAIFASLGYALVLASAILWVLALNRLVGDTDWYVKEHLLLWFGVSLCVLALVASWFSRRRNALPISIAGCIVALNWIGTVLST